MDIAGTHFNNTIIVIDKYHWIRQITWAINRVRKQEQKKLYHTRRKYFKRSRFLLLKRRRYLSEGQVDQVGIRLQTPHRLATAYLLKEKFYKFVDTPDRKTALKRLKEWYVFVET